MKKVFFAAILIVLGVLFSGCTQINDNNPVCAQVITFAIDAQGNCTEFPTSCIPDGYTKVDKCPNPCEGIECKDSCKGTTSLKNGRCETGECVFGTVDENSVDCGYKNFDLETEAILRYCEYSQYFDTMSLFLSVQNLGENSPKPGSTVWLVSSDINNKVYQPINNTYGKNIFWWQDVFFANKPYRGQLFEVQNMTEFKNFDYKFIYCELKNNNTDSCTAKNGLVLFSGNTAKDCNIIT